MLFGINVSFNFISSVFYLCYISGRVSGRFGISWVSDVAKIAS